MTRRRYLVAYDVREARRLRAVHAAMKGFGDPMQFSVFLCDLDGMERVRMLATLRSIINEREDSVAIVDLGEPRGRGDACLEFLGVMMGVPRQGARVY